MSIVKTGSWQQLMLAKNITQLTGGLHESQVLQLKRWPLLMVPNAESSEFVWSPDTKSVSFNLTLSKKPFPKNLLQRLEFLDKSVKQLLGSEWKISVVAGKKTLYSSKRSHGRNNSSRATSRRGAI